MSLIGADVARLEALVVAKGGGVGQGTSGHGAILVAIRSLARIVARGGKVEQLRATEGG